MTIDIIKNNKLKDSDKVIALCRAGNEVHNGRWINGALSHIFTELLQRLEDNGWDLVRK